MSVDFILNGSPVRVPDDDPGTRVSLLDALRGHCGITSVKDGCSPQGQCGCCTVWVDGEARVACVTPLRRVAGRSVTTLEGLDGEVTERWAAALSAEGGSQCGFCTPGIVMRLESLGRSPVQEDGEAVVRRALSAHLCRCTGWHGIVRAESARHRTDGPRGGATPDGATQRATLEGGADQRVEPATVLGGAGFAADTAPPGCLFAVLDADGEWVLAESLPEARRRAATVQGRRSSVEAVPVLQVPDGDWDARLATSWVEPAYLETDAAWCEPGGEPVGPLANGGAFGAKVGGPLAEVAHRLADRAGRPVLALYRREECVRLGPKRPPVAGGMRADGRGAVRVVATDGIAEAIARAAPGAVVEACTVPGPPTSATLRAAGWLEAFCLAVAAGAGSPLGGRDGDAVRVAPEGAGWASVALSAEGVEVVVGAGDPLHEGVLRSYVEGAVHMALGLVTSESIAVGADGTVGDLTVRSFGVLGALDVPAVQVHVDPAGGPPLAVSDAVFVATAAATWLAHGSPPAWPTRTPPLPGDRR